MTLKFLIPGKAREKYLTEGYEEYLKRLSRFAKTSLVWLPEVSLPETPSSGEIAKALAEEAANALRQIKASDCLFLVDIHAPLVSTEELAKKLQTKVATQGNLVFLLGSSYGLDDSLRRRADVAFSLSPLTFTHYLALLVTLEQVYRSFKILSGESYDK
jgi:23S rRNA (pseudouridine1915-N3)-methyltransferase